MDSFKFSIPTEIHFGNGVVEKIGFVTRDLGCNALIVTGFKMAKNSGALDVVQDSLAAAGVQSVLYDQIEPQPSVESFEAGAAVARSESCQMVIGIGAECPLDAAKVIAALATNDGVLTDYVNGKAFREQPLPVVAVPVTAGSGAEVTPFATIKVKEPHSELRTIRSPLLVPRKAFLGPEFCTNLPDAVAVYNGLDALSHAMEAFLSDSASPLVELMALESIGITAEYLPKVLDDPANLTYRSYMSYAALLAGIAVGHTDYGPDDAMGRILTVRLGMPHGKANGLLLPVVTPVLLRRNTAKARRMAVRLGVAEENAEDIELENQIVGFLNRVLTMIGVTAEKEVNGIVDKERLVKEMAEMAIRQFPALGDLRIDGRGVVDSAYRHVVFAGGGQ